MRTIGAAMKVLVIDDEPALASELDVLLRGAGYEVTLGSCELAREGPDVILVETLQTCRALRACGDRTPVLSLSRDCVASLDAGADAWLPRSYAGEELLARLRALARRAV